MDFEKLPRKHLQALCKMNGIPANITNVAMVQKLSSLEVVLGLDEISGVSASQIQETPAKGTENQRPTAEVQSIGRPLRSTRSKATKQEEQSGVVHAISTRKKTAESHKQEIFYDISSSSETSTRKGDPPPSKKPGNCVEKVDLASNTRRISRRNTDTGSQTPCAIAKRIPAVSSKLKKVVETETLESEVSVKRLCYTRRQTASSKDEREENNEKIEEVEVKGINVEAIELKYEENVEILNDVRISGRIADMVSQNPRGFANRLSAVSSTMKKEAEPERLESEVSVKRRCSTRRLKASSKEVKEENKEKIEEGGIKGMKLGAINLNYEKDVENVSDVQAIACMDLLDVSARNEGSSENGLKSLTQTKIESAYMDCDAVDYSGKEDTFDEKMEEEPEVVEDAKGKVEVRDVSVEAKIISVETSVKDKEIVAIVEESYEDKMKEQCVKGDASVMEESNILVQSERDNFDLNPDNDDDAGGEEKLDKSKDSVEIETDNCKDMEEDDVIQETSSCSPVASYCSDSNDSNAFPHIKSGEMSLDEKEKGEHSVEKDIEEPEESSILVESDNCKEVKEDSTTELGIEETHEVQNEEQEDFSVVVIENEDETNVSAQSIVSIEGDFENMVVEKVIEEPVSVLDGSSDNEDQINVSVYMESPKVQDTKDENKVDLLMEEICVDNTVTEDQKTFLESEHQSYASDKIEEVEDLSVHIASDNLEKTKEDSKIEVIIEESCQDQIENQKDFSDTSIEKVDETSIPDTSTIEVNMQADFESNVAEKAIGEPTSFLVSSADNEDHKSLFENKAVTEDNKDLSDKTNPSLGTSSNNPENVEEKTLETVVCKIDEIVEKLTDAASICTKSTASEVEPQETLSLVESIKVLEASIAHYEGNETEADISVHEDKSEIVVEYEKGGETVEARVGGGKEKKGAGNKENRKGLGEMSLRRLKKELKMHAGKNQQVQVETLRVPLQSLSDNNSSANFLGSL